MASQIGRLKALTVTRAKEKGLYADGAGLYLQIAAAGSKSWIFRYRMNGRKTPRDMGLGPVHTVTLAEARDKAREARKLILEGVDPIEAKRARKQARALEAASTMVFKDCAEKYIAAHKAGWRNAKHAGQWTSTLETYAYPVFGSLPVASIDTALVTKVLEPIWNNKTQTASRVRGRIEAILDWATARAFRVTAHGFRSTFRDWAAEQTNYPREVAEMALAHTIEDKVEAAYRRGDLFDKRKRLMAEWAKYCGTAPREAKVIAINR